MDTYLVEIILNVHVSYFFDVCFGAYNNMILFPNSEKILEVVTVFMTRKLRAAVEKDSFNEISLHSDLPSQSNELTRGPPELSRHFRSWGSSHQRKSALCPKFDIVWLYRSPIPVRRRGVISSFKWFLPAFATRRGRGEGVITLCVPSNSIQALLLSLLLHPYIGENAGHF